MRLGKPVFAEALYLPENARGELVRIAVLLHAFENALLEMFEPALATPCRHRSAQRIGFARGEIGRDAQKLHALLLEDRYAERAAEHVLDLIGLVDDLL